MADANDLLLMGVGVLIGLGFASLMFYLINFRPVAPSSSMQQPYYVPYPSSLVR